MAVPEPKKNESEKKYIKRCTATLVKLGRPKDHASAVCRTKWEKGDVSTRKLFERIDRIVGEDAGLTGCPDCGSSVNINTSPVACGSACGWYQKRSYSFKRGTPGRKKRKPRK
jgi:hypothetical protein